MPTLGIGGLVIALVIALGMVWAGMRHQAGAVPLPGRTRPDPFTIGAAGVVEFLAGLAALATLGLLIAAVAFSTPSRHDNALRPHAEALVRRARVTAYLWGALSLAMVVLSAGFNNGVAVGLVVATPLVFVDATQVSQAWLAAALAAVLVAFLAGAARTYGTALATLLIALLAPLLPVVTGNVTVGANHDLGTDGSILSTLTTAVWLGTAVAVLAWGRNSHLPERVRRYQRIAMTVAAVAVPARLVQAWFELAGTSPTASPFGWLLVAMGLLALVLLVRLAHRAALLRRGEVERAYASITGDVAIAVLLVGIQAITSYIPPPRFAIPQDDIQVNFLGYPVSEEPTWATLLLPGRPSLLLAVIAVLAIGWYLLAYRRLVRGGGHWPVGRLVAWVVGWLVFGWAVGAGIWSYSAAAFSYHMVVHMTIDMVAPTLIVIGGPVTLAVQAFGDTPGPRPLPAAREIIAAVLAWRPLAYLLHPLPVTVNFLGSLYLIYFTDAFQTLMKYHWAHQWMMLHFFVSGYLFYGLVIGTDRPPRPLPPIAKIGFLLAAMPFHALFAVFLMTADHLVGEQFYLALDVPWVGDLLHDQYVGGVITWIVGELPMLCLIPALVWQWIRNDRRLATGAVGGGAGPVSGPAEFGESPEAYEQMLAEFAERKGSRLQP